MLALTGVGSRLFRNQVGLAWQGRATQVHTRYTTEVYPGDVVLRQARRVSTGLCVGSHDLIGWTPKTVTPEMLGTRLAVFTSIEVKLKGTKTTDQQHQFGAAVKEAGGISAIVDDHIKAADAVILFRTSGIRA